MVANFDFLSTKQPVTASITTPATATLAQAAKCHLEPYSTQATYSPEFANL